jgi:Putative Actinobacterial Holin-X, holin superfamily III
MSTRVEDEGPVDVEDRSLGQLMTEMTGEVSQLMRAEIDLAKAEIKEEAGKAAKAGAVLGTGGMFALLAVILLSFAAAWGLAAAIPDGFAFMIIGVAYGLIATVCFVIGRNRLRDVNPVPQETVETIKEDVQWAKAQKS